MTEEFEAAQDRPGHQELEDFCTGVGDASAAADA